MSILTTSLLSAAIFSAIASAPPTPVVAVPLYISINEWQPEIADRIVVDTQANVGYLIHIDGRYTEFPVITGQRKEVDYIGRHYYAATPNRVWTMDSKHYKDDYYTFGPTGRFLRLYNHGKDGELIRSPYGFHEHAAERWMFDRDSRYQSMGCVIVKRAILDIIEDTYDVNEEFGITVITQYGVEEPVQTAFQQEGSI